MTTKTEKLAAIDAQIAKLQAKRAEVEASNDFDSSTVVAGTWVTFNYGRAEKARVLTGIVTGVKPAVEGLRGSSNLFKIAVGKGFDAELLTVFPGQLIGTTEAPAVVTA